MLAFESIVEILRPIDKCLLLDSSLFIFCPEFFYPTYQNKLT